MSDIDLVESQATDWTLLAPPGCFGVQRRALLHRPDIDLTMLRFDELASIDEHSAPLAIEVICLDGQGFTSVGDREAPILAGQTVTWPAGLPHRLWTKTSGMVTLMVERQAEPL